MAITAFVFIFQYGNIGDPGTFTFLYIATIPIIIINIVIPITIYRRKEDVRAIILEKYREWVPIVVVTGVSGLYIIANIDGMVRMTHYNADYFREHRKECYSCNVWIARFFIALLS